MDFLQSINGIFWANAASPILITLDILAVSYLIYHVLLFVRGTRAMPIIFGLVFVAGVFILADKFNLVALNWILGNFLGSVILVIVVLFQDDLRRGLMKMGLVTGFSSESSQSVQQSLKEISKACDELVSRRLGALIVIRREVGLEEFSERSIKMDALVSHQLLVSIFLPSSPVHDGAVIIENSRIVGAGAFLPLSFDQTISSKYGTRHRAAVGITESTDAVVVVVSEENAKISVVCDRRITKDLNEASLYNLLNKLIVTNKVSFESGYRKMIARFTNKTSSAEIQDSDS
jgi:diadenylate cyclase